jgi:hypothetical protein
MDEQQSHADVDPAAAAQGPSEHGPREQQLSEEELREAYAAELRRVSSTELVLQTAASLINVGAYRLGLAGGDPADRDLEQVRDAIDGVRALLPILERRGGPEQLRPLRDALSQLQLAYARESQAGADARAHAAATPGEGAATEQPSQPQTQGEPGEPARSSEPAAGDAAGAGAPEREPQEGDPRRPGPAESSGRLWVPGSG